MYLALLIPLTVGLQVVGAQHAACGHGEPKAGAPVVATPTRAGPGSRDELSRARLARDSGHSWPDERMGLAGPAARALLGENQTSSLANLTAASAPNASGVAADASVNSRTGIDEQARELRKFRLEFNKFRILSNLGITRDPDEIRPTLDEETRQKIITTTPFKDAPASGTGSRHKRSLTCDQVKSEKSACCMERFYVNFTHIGWDKWILHPPGYFANYCRGQCDLSHSKYYHGTMLEKYSNFITLCCSPKQMAPLKVLYIDEENKVHQKSIPDMIVESCGCA